MLKPDEPIVIGNGCVIRSGCTVYFGTQLGNNVQLGHDVFVRERCRIGNNTVLGTKTIVEWESVIGRNCLIEGNVFISERTVIEDRVFMGPQSRTTSDKYMQTVNPYIPDPARLCEGARLGAGTTVLPGVIVGYRGIVGAGCVIAENVSPNTTVYAKAVKAKEN